jgi:hypothetical protein
METEGVFQIQLYSGYQHVYRFLANLELIRCRETQSFSSSWELFIILSEPKTRYHVVR